MHQRSAMSTHPGLGGAGSHRLEHIMGMTIGIDIRDEDVDPAAFDDAFNWLRTVDTTFSTYKRDSQINRINRRELAVADADPDVRDVLQRCEQLRFETGGYFNIRTLTLPTEAGVRDDDRAIWAIDPSGLVKGWSVERAARILESAGARNFSINAGGDIRVRGGALPDPAWRIGIQHPFLLDQVAAVVVSNDLAIATSGAYARGDHIVDPHTGRIPSGVLSVTIVGPDLATADAYATAAYAMGEAGAEWTRGLVLSGYDAMTILADQTVLFTPGFPSE
jgi:thiamine biosynthesis lipoprotein